MAFSAQFTAVVGMLAATLAASLASDRRRPEPLRRSLEEVPRSLAGWRMVDRQALEPRILRILEPAGYVVRTYRKDGFDLDLFIAYYEEQRARETVHSPRACLPGHGWEIRAPGSAAVRVDGAPVKINRYAIRNGGDLWVVLYWYQSRRRIVANEYAGKLLLLRDALLEGRTSGSLVRIMVPDTPRAVEDGLAFAAALIPELQRCL
ncbi:MAG: hypothetical protein BWY25_01832 [Chloroflexi bacterium ADurb.Bin222]|nr:MAG: hypothetical protein BWY25_01832 [Chloroflexi bacterium ADurb.Bin222]